MKQYRNATFVSLVLIGILIGAVRYAGTDWFGRRGPNRSANAPDLYGQELSPQTLEAARQECLRRAQVHLDHVHDESRRLANEHLKELAEFFIAAKKRTPIFADAVLGWKSKWRLATDHVPYFGTSGAHARFVAERIAHHLFDQKEVERVIAEVIASLHAEVESLEGAMFVALRRDLENISGIGRLDAFATIDWQTFSRDVNAQGEEAARLSIRDDVVQVLVSMIVTDAIVRVANRMGVSAAILGGGAAASEMTLGTSLVIGLAVDQAVGWAWNTIADPKGQLVKRLNDGIDELHAALVDGAIGSTSLRRHIQEVIEHRDRVRREAVLNGLRGKGAE